MDLKHKFERAASTVRRLQPLYERFIVKEYENALRELEELVPKLREEAWQRFQAERQRLEAEKRDVWQALEATRRLRAQAEDELKVARASGDPRAAELAAKVEELKQRLQELDARHRELLRRLRELKETDAFEGTLAELKERCLEPDFYLDRTWLRAMLAGAWRWLQDDARVFVRFKLEDGQPVEYAPKQSRRR